MVSCPSMNDTISCADGCCGNVSDQKCCAREVLTEGTLVIICVIGGVLVIAVAAALIICITSKNKNRVVRISPRHQMITHHDRETTRQRRAFPKPPPYSELPPQYDGPPSAESPVTPLPGSTLHRGGSIRSTNGIRIQASSAIDSRRNNSHYSTDPPPYLSIIAGRRSNSPVPYTPGEFGGSATESDSRYYGNQVASGSHQREGNRNENMILGRTARRTNAFENTRSYNVPL